ncbi:hypothetical protein [Azospirillum halopraeferens]|uniref:hypothetical protein n=1 Tax=Azospirillum halopraeferens TaxID=34010 RepID=UPI0003F6BA8E|nr:hypothetical protein [Azospirillum halopraeferens]
MAVDTTLARRASLVIAATVCLAVVLTLVLAYYKFQRTLIEVATSRLTVVVEEVRRKTEYGLTLGLDLAELEDARALLDRAAATAPEVVGLVIVAEDGSVLFATDDGRSETQAAAGGGPSVTIDGDSARLSADIRNSFGQVVGAVVLHATLATLRAEVAGVRDRLVQVGLGLLALGGLVTLVAVRVLLGRARFDGVEGQGERLAAAVREAEESMDEAERLLDRAQRS